MHKRLLHSTFRHKCGWICWEKSSACLFFHEDLAHILFCREARRNATRQEFKYVPLGGKMQRSEVKDGRNCGLSQMNLWESHIPAMKISQMHRKTYICENLWQSCFPYLSRSLSLWHVEVAETIHCQTQHPGMNYSMFCNSRPIWRRATFMLPCVSLKWKTFSAW